MIAYKTGNLFESNADILVNTVNCEGVMGKGIALQFKEKFPQMYKDYRDYCKKGLLKPGDYYQWRNFDIGLWDIYEHDPRYIINFATKNSWRNKSKLEWIEEGLKKLVVTLKYKYDHDYAYSIAFPKLGCNNGGLDWETQVKPLMEKYLKPLNMLCYIYENDN